jgi:hypothetical protein
MKIFSERPTIVAEIRGDPVSDSYTISHWGCCDNDQEALETAIDLAERGLPSSPKKQLLPNIERDLKKSGIFQYGHEDDSRRFSVLILKPYAPQI